MFTFENECSRRKGGGSVIFLVKSRRGVGLIRDIPGKIKNGGGKSVIYLVKSRGLKKAPHIG